MGRHRGTVLNLRMILNIEDLGGMPGAVELYAKTDKADLGPIRTRYLM